MKACTRCKVVKPLEGFYKNLETLDGRASWCKQCAHWNKKRWHKNTYKQGTPQREAVLLQQKVYRETNPERYSELQRIRRQKPRNRAVILEGKKRYREQSRELNRFWQQRYKNLKRNAVGTYTREQLKARIEYYGHKCYICTAPYKEIDHVIPLSRGGTNWPGNLRPICPPCNRSKGNRLENDRIQIKIQPSSPQHGGSYLKS